MSNINAWLEVLEPYLHLIWLAASVLLFILFFTLRGKLTKLVVSFVWRVLNHRKSWVGKDTLTYIFLPCRSFFVVLGAKLALNLNGFGKTVFFEKSFRILVIALGAWVLVRLWDSCAEHILTFKRTASNGEEASLNLNLSKTLVTVLRKVVKLLILVFAGIIILSETGANVSALITGLGLGGLTFALAAQDTASNLFSGLVILLDRPFAVDDWIQTPTIEGVVEDITFRSTRIRTFANALVVVPNSSLTGQPITNWSRMEKRRVLFSIGLEYGSTSEQLQSCIKKLEQMLSACEELAPDPVVSFNSFQNSSLEITILYFTKATDYATHQKVKEKINLEIMHIVEEEKLSFAFPTQTLHIEPSKPLSE